MQSLNLYAVFIDDLRSFWESSLQTTRHFAKLMYSSSRAAWDIAATVLHLLLVKPPLRMKIAPEQQLVIEERLRFRQWPNDLTR